MTLFFLHEGYRLPITNMFDVDGEETNDPDAACTLVARLPNGKWLASQCDPHDIVEVGA